MVHKYVRHNVLGFILFPATDDLWHSSVGRFLLQRLEGSLISAGFVYFQENGLPKCYGESESLEIKSKEEDTALLIQQLGLKEKTT